MRNVDLLRLSIHNLLLHKIRSFLTSLGIIFGVGSVIAMLAISEGAKKRALDQIASMGIDNIIVYSQKPSAVNQKITESNNNSMVQAFGLDKINLDHIKTMDNVKSVATIRHSRQKVISGIKRLGVKLISTSENFYDFTNTTLVRGRLLNEVDTKNLNQVCVLGKNVIRKMFRLGEVNVIGRQIKIARGLFTVVGVVENNSGTNLPEVGDINDTIIIPHVLSEVIYGSNAPSGGGRRSGLLDIEYDTFIVKVKTLSSIGHTSKRIQNYLTKTHKKSKDWDMIVPLSLFQQKEQTQKIFTVVMASIASISLIVGGVGIMNIMLANIYERRKEIGTRRALGAKQGDILRQFLMETIFLTSIGGISGVVLGIALSQIVTHYANWPTIYSVNSILISLVISSTVGIVFGTYPAIKAAEQNPIDVLRSE